MRSKGLDLNLPVVLKLLVEERRVCRLLRKFLTMSKATGAEHLA